MCVKGPFTRYDCDSEIILLRNLIGCIGYTVQVFIWCNCNNIQHIPLHSPFTLHSSSHNVRTGHKFTGRIHGKIIVRKSIIHIMVQMYNIYSEKIIYRSDTVNSNTVNSKFHLIRSFFDISARFLSFHV